MIRIVLVISLLIINTVFDIRTRKIPLSVLVGFGVVGILINMFFKEYSFVELIAGIAVGAGLFVVSRITDGQIGEGDAFLFMLTGLYLGGINNISLLLWASILCALVAGLLLLTRQVNKRDEIPFVPFVLLAYVGQVLL